MSVNPTPVYRSIDVFVVSAVRYYRDGLCRAFGDDPRFRVAGSAPDHASGERALLAMKPAPPVTLLDVTGDVALSGARRLRTALPDMRLVALVIEEGDEPVVAWAEV